MFGGVHPGHSSREKSCSNALYIFNPEFELWYQPIVEGDKPLPRFGSVLFPKHSCSTFTVPLFSFNINKMFVLNRHSATLLSQRLVIFGGRKTATYLNDLHVLDLGKCRFWSGDVGSWMQWYLSFFLLALWRIHGVHSCEVWEHAPAASRVSPELINLETCHRRTHLV